jgi:hypothetical protein
MYGAVHKGLNLNNQSQNIFLCSWISTASEDSLLHFLNVKEMEWVLDRETYTKGHACGGNKRTDSRIEFLRQMDPGSDSIKKSL